MKARRIVTVVTVLCVALALSSCASSSEARLVRVVNDKAIIRGCQYVGIAADNEIGDLQKKAVKLGGNVALLTPERRSKGGYFKTQDYMTADVYRCEGLR